MASFDLTGMMCFRNVDLDVYSRTSLEPLATAFGEAVSVLYVGRSGRRFQAHFEVADSFEKDADTIMLEFVGLVRRLPPRVRTLWNAAKSRDFNIGIQSAHEPPSLELRISAATLKAVAAIGGSIVMTTYAPEPDVRRASKMKSPTQRR